MTRSARDAALLAAAPLQSSPSRAPMAGSGQTRAGRVRCDFGGPAAEATGTSENPPRLELIERSHQRSAALGLTRGDKLDLDPMIRSDLGVARERNQRLYAHAAPVMQMLVEQIANTASMILLTDAQGTILHSVGDDDFLERAGKVALTPGENWAEHSKGTNAIGTALFEGAPTLVHAHEHYMRANDFLTCSAAPIFDPRGNVLGVLDVTGDHRGYHQHTMGLVRMSARMIENHWLSDDFANRLRLHFHSRAEFIGTLLEGIVVVGPDGRILGANRAALDQLGLSGAALRMQSVTSLFGTTPPAIYDHYRMPLSAPMHLSLADGRLFHVSARFDWPSRPVVGVDLPHEAHAPQGPHAAHQPPGSHPPHPPHGPHDLHEPHEPHEPQDPHEPHELPDRGEPPLALRPKPLDLSGPDRPLAPPPAPGRRFGPAPPGGLEYLRTGDPQVDLVVQKIRRILDRDIPLLILGETGTGKELLARAVHQDSARARQPFVAVNCASIPETLIEAELFGYEDGAFTGARRKGAPGKIVQASGGTLFLDEIGDMPQPLQARLLRVLQERCVMPLGSTRSIPVDIAIVGATHRNLREMIERQQFREDLYYRLNGLALRLPPLRDRSDLDALARRILRAERSRDTPRIGARVLELFGRYRWPGNIRQLANVLRTAAVMSTGESEIGAAHLSDDFLEDAQCAWADAAAMPAAAASALRWVSTAATPSASMAAMPSTPAAAGAGEPPQPCAFPAVETPAAGDPPPVGWGAPPVARERRAPEPPAPRPTLEQAEIEMIRSVLEAAQGNISAASKQLGISRNTIYRKLRWNVAEPAG